jgi:hypothetical protein
LDSGKCLRATERKARDGLEERKARDGLVERKARDGLA